jgi:hypothetical protein
VTRVIRGNGQPAPRARELLPTARRIDAARFAARIEAERTIAEARASADAIAREAEQRGRERAHAEAAALLLAAQREAARVAEHATDLVVTATKAVAERALGQALSIDPTPWAREALTAFRGARTMTVRANAETAPRLRDLGVEVVVDSELPAHTLVVLTELGDARVELKTQVDAFVEAIRDVLASEVRSRA